MAPFMWPMALYSSDGHLQSRPGCVHNKTQMQSQPVKELSLTAGIFPSSAGSKSCLLKAGFVWGTISWPNSEPIQTECL